MDAEFEAKRFAIASWTWGLLVAFALVSGFAVPSHAFADDSSPQQESIVAVDDVAASPDDAQVSEATASDELDDNPYDAPIPSSAQEATGAADEADEADDEPEGLAGHTETVAGSESSGFASDQVKGLVPIASGLPKGQGVIANAGGVSTREEQGADKPAESAAPSSKAAAEQDASAPPKPALGEKAEESQTGTRTTAKQDAETSASAAETRAAKHTPPAPASTWVDSASAYEEAAGAVEETPAEQAAEPAEIIASPAAVRYPGSSDTAPGVPCAYIGPAQTRVDAPAPSSLHAVSHDRAVRGVTSTYSLAAKDRNLHATLLYHKARCRSP